MPKRRRSHRLRFFVLFLTGFACGRDGFSYKRRFKIGKNLTSGASGLAEVPITLLMRLGMVDLIDEKRKWAFFSSGIAQ